MTTRPTCCESFSPMFFQVLPPSADLYTPSPHEALLRALASPVPTHTTSGFDADTATAPSETVDCWSKTGAQVTPHPRCGTDTDTFTMYAVFEDGSRQYRVSEGDVVKVDYRAADVGSRVEFNRVLLYANGTDVNIGRPLVEGMRVVGDVVDH